MRITAAALGALLVVTVLWDAFETVVLPRRVKRRFRLTNLFYSLTWPVYRACARRIRSDSIRDSVLGYYGPLGLLMLLGTWAVGMVLAFGILQWGIGSSTTSSTGMRGFWSDLYFSASSFVTLGLGDVTPLDVPARIATVIEAGLGLGFLAIVISYLPTLYQTSAQREVLVSRLDSMAGSPPCGASVLKRFRNAPQERATFFRECEHWSTELMDSIQSFPVLAHYRSQHSDQSWLGALSCILDACALSLALEDPNSGGNNAGELAFAMGCHAAEDICAVLGLSVAGPTEDRLSAPDRDRLAHLLEGAGESARSGGDHWTRFAQLRARYEPFLCTLADRLLLPMPPLVPAETGGHAATDHHHHER